MATQSHLIKQTVSGALILRVGNQDMFIGEIEIPVEFAVTASIPDKPEPSYCGRGPCSNMDGHAGKCTT